MPKSNFPNCPTAQNNCPSPISQHLYETHIGYLKSLTMLWSPILAFSRCWSPIKAVKDFNTLKKPKQDFTTLKKPKQDFATLTESKFVSCIDTQPNFEYSEGGGGATSPVNLR